MKWWNTCASPDDSTDSTGGKKAKTTFLKIVMIVKTVMMIKMCMMMTMTAMTIIVSLSLTQLILLS